MPLGCVVAKRELAIAPGCASGVAEAVLNLLFCEGHPFRSYGTDQMAVLSFRGTGANAGRQHPIALDRGAPSNKGVTVAEALAAHEHDRPAWLPQRCRPLPAPARIDARDGFRSGVPCSRLLPAGA